MAKHQQLVGTVESIYLSIKEHEGEEGSTAPQQPVTAVESIYLTIKEDEGEESRTAPQQPVTAVESYLSIYYGG